jgi:hypothetical protein
VTDRAQLRRELDKLRAGFKRRSKETRRLPFVAPDLVRMREEISRLERALKSRDLQRESGRA